MDKEKQQVLQVAKEITVKFIEIGRISPGNFPEVFEAVYKAVHQTVTGKTAGEPDVETDRENAE